jgi:hypothetical protein
MTTPDPIYELQSAAVAALRDYEAIPDDERTAHLRAAGESFVSAREHFFTREGEPDWLGRTHAYRQFVREVLRDARVPSELLATVQAAIRYHTGNVLRERLSEDQIAELGLRVESPRERSVEKRQKHAETIALFSGHGGARLADPDLIVGAAERMEAALRRISLPDVAALPARDRRRVRAAVLRVYTLAGEVAEAADHPRRVTK